MFSLFNIRITESETDGYFCVEINYLHYSALQLTICGLGVFRLISSSAYIESSVVKRWEPG